jgi:type IV pilus assembly protein PilE
MAMKTKPFGFTLLELMIVVAIVAILASLAIAGYDFATRKTRRAAAQGCLTEAAQQMERFYTTHMTYTGAVLPACSADVTQYYAVGFVAGEPTAATYTLQAVPQGPQAKDSCGTMTLNDRTQKTPATDCW